MKSFYFFHIFDYENQVSSLKSSLIQINNHIFKNSPHIIKKKGEFTLNLNSIYRSDILQCILCKDLCFNHFNTMLLHLKYWHSEFLVYHVYKSHEEFNTFHVLIFPNKNNKNEDELAEWLDRTEKYKSYVLFNRGKRKFKYSNAVIQAMNLTNIKINDM